MKRIILLTALLSFFIPSVALATPPTDDNDKAAKAQKAAEHKELVNYVKNNEVTDPSYHIIDNDSVALIFEKDADNSHLENFADSNSCYISSPKDPQAMIPPERIDKIEKVVICDSPIIIQKLRLRTLRNIKAELKQNKDNEKH